jgi:maleylpyruvate isomerase
MSDPLRQALTERLLPDATRRLVRSADALEDHEYAEPSALPDWTRGHVLAHLALNAEALAGVLGGIVAGEAVPMYPSQEARDADVAELAAAEPAAIRSRLLGGGSDLADAIDAVPEDRWATTVERTPGGRTFAAAQVPQMRLREVEIHHADLAVGYDRSSWPREFVELTLDAMFVRDAADVPLSAYATDLDRTWTSGEAGPVVRGTGADLAWWLTGRGSGEGLTTDGGALPRIGAW